MSVRWFFFEPFTVPSGSMFPNLMINDYILVNKLASGIRVPYSKTWLLGPKIPKRGMAVVFWSKKSQVYFVKRLMGLPGDSIKIKGHQVLEINGQPVATRPVPLTWNYLKEDFPYEESIGVIAFKERYSKVSDMEQESITLMYAPMDDQVDQKEKVFNVPKEKLFFMGDHRSASSDSRSWGFVDVNDLVGPVQLILFSCAKKNVTTQFCDPRTIRWNRFMTKFHKFDSID